MLENIEEDHDQEDDEAPVPGEIPIEDALSILLDPYVPAMDRTEADAYYTTSEIIKSLEEHYSVPQGSGDFVTITAGAKVVEELKRRGFKYVNTGGLQLEWMMKRR
jgi:hypothetical protein